MGLSVLLVDESCVLRWRLHRQLSTASGVARVVQAESYVQALQVLLIDAPDVIVVDPGMSGGLDLLQVVRDARPHPFVIALASFPLESSKRALEPGGIDAILEDPHADAVFDKLTEFDRAVRLVKGLARRRMN